MGRVTGRAQAAARAVIEGWEAIAFYLSRATGLDYTAEGARWLGRRGRWRLPITSFAGRVSISIDAMREWIAAEERRSARKGRA